ncbi:MAG: ABC transporter substrate-binding protein [Pseudomonadota bacterium]
MLARITATLTLALLPFSASAETDPADWDAVQSAAEGQTVFWHAWGGSTTTNDFIAWVGSRVSEDYGVTLKHVKLSDTAEAVSRVVAEKSAGVTEGGAVDMIWINGENFASMKESDLLFGPFAEALPNWSLVDLSKPVTVDFTVPTDGLESPWAAAQVVFMYDSADVPEPPQSMAELLAWAEANPGRVTLPQPPDFLGATFLKQALYGVVDDPSVLLAPVSEADYRAVTTPLWDYMDALTPALWRGGRAYPQSGPRQIQLLADDEIDIAISFSPGEASTAIANFELPDTIRTFVLDSGTIGNASFVAIPFNANAKEGAMVVANFLLSPEAQARALDPEVLGYGTVLDLEKLSPEERASFESTDLGIATLSPDELGPALAEPHPTWMVEVEKDWTERFGVAE